MFIASVLLVLLLAISHVTVAEPVNNLVSFITSNLFIFKKKALY